MKKNKSVGTTQDNPNKKQITSQKRVVRESSKKKVKKVTSYPLYIPNNIDLEDWLTKYPVHVPNARDKLVYLLHLIHAVPAFIKEEEHEEDNGFTILHSVYLQSIIDEYAILFKWLINHGIVEIDNRYVLGDRSKGYRFNLKYRTEVKKVYITTWTLIRRIIQRKIKNLKQRPLHPKHLIDITANELKISHLGYSVIAESRLSSLKRWFDEKFTIDKKRALDYLNQRLIEDLKSSHVKFPMRNYNLAKIVVESIEGQLPKFHIDDTAGRLHTLLTCLTSELRTFLRYDGMHLTSLDVKNSQPVLSLSLLDFDLFVKNRMHERISTYNPEYDNSDYYIMLGDLIKRNSNNSDTVHYRKLVLSGKLYSEFGTQLQNLGILNTNINPDELKSVAKRGLLKSLFNTNHAIVREELQQAFKKAFPSVYEIFEFVKKKNYKTLACILQNLESEIILHKACAELASNHPDCPLFTIHDSIASTKENILVIKEILTKHLKEALGNEVMLEEENWDDDYFEKMKLKKQSIILNDSPIQEKNNPVFGYGYFDYDLLIIPYLNSLTKTANALGLRRNKFMEGLRALNIISDFNLPQQEFEEAKLLLTNECNLKLKRGKTINLFSTKVTDEGVEFLKQLAKDNPDLFPKKKVRIKRT